MCGRLNCYCKYSSYSDRIGSKLKDEPPEWIEPHKFRPSPNVAPTSYVPVLYRDESGRFVVRAMKWGISLPHVSSLVHNVRSGTLSTSKFFLGLLDRKQTCAVLCDGFYEWKGKRPFFFYDGQTGFEGSTLAEWSEDEWIRTGPPVMALAGVYHVGDEHTCSVITRDATKTKDIHHRITVMLSNKEEILSWLCPSPPMELLKQLNAITNESLSYYEVNDRVNSSKYQGNDCHVPKSKASSSGPLDLWFSRSKDAPESPKPNLPVASVVNVSNKRKSAANPPVRHKKPAAGTAKSSSASSPAKNKGGGPLDRWISKTKKPPE